MSHYRAAVFDLDGTTLDTLQDLSGSVNYALEAYGLPKRSMEEVRQFTGNGIRRLIDLSVPMGTPSSVTDAVFAAFKDHYAVHCEDHTHAYPGIPETVTAIRSLGIRTGVVSNKADFAVQKLIASEFRGLFDFVTGEKEGIRRKPSPDMVHACLKAFGVPPKEAVYIGDSEVDIQTARASGLDLIAVSWGFRSRQQLLEKGAKVIVDEPSDLISAFRD